MPTKELLIEYWRKKFVDERLIAAFNNIPRELFVPKQFQEIAYLDQPLPTFRQQSVSQPTTTMIMLQALSLQPGEKVFELGSGGGYETALISKMVGKKGKVVSAEVIPELVQIAKTNSEMMGIHNLLFLEADGSEGYLPQAPYDKAIITAACPAIPQPIIDQLREGGIVIAPIGDIKEQVLVKGTKVNGRLDLEFLGSFQFMPMKGKHGFKECDLLYD